MTSGCAGWRLNPAADTTASGDVLCAETFEPRVAHAGALLRDGGPLSRSTGRVLLEQMGNGCMDGPDNG